MIVFNLIGLLMLAISFGIAYGATHLIGTADEVPLLIIAGRLLLFAMQRTVGSTRPGIG